MKLKPIRLRDYLIRFAILIAAYLVLHQVMIRTNMMERVMTFSFSWWQLLIIVLFLVTRFATYLFIVPGLIGLAVYYMARFLMNPKQLSTSSG
jgi:hypothetical protein